ncbi:hypothetical protein H5T57_01860, partial [Candidatus Bipolaricaulota bacterium]|nr:hypothetical protein [Candidatus Bipolaricaulota bacterium]
VRLDGPADLLWILDNGITKLEIPAGRDFTLPEPLFAALDEGTGKLMVWVEVPANFSAKDPVTVAPTITLWLKEAGHIQSFKVTDPVPDRAVAAGLEIVEVRVPQAGKVMSPSPATLLYSELKLGDQDRNATPVRLDSLALKPLGTLTAVGSVEVVDQGGRLLGFSSSLDKPVALISPDGKPLLLSDDGSLILNLTLTLPEKIPLGASLLLSHEIAVEEVLPREWLARSDALTKFKGTHAVAPREAVFFGKPTVKLTKAEDKALLSTDGETIGLLSGKLSVEPLEFVDLSAQSLSGYRLTTKPLEDGISFTLEAGRATAKAGDLAASVPSLKPVRVPAKEMTVNLSLEVEKVVDWAGITLPFALGPREVSFSFVVPQIGILSVPERKDVAVIHADTSLSALKLYVYFDPELPVELSEVQGLEPYAAEVVPEEKPEPGRILLSIALPPEKEPTSGALAQLVFGKKVEEEVKLPVRIEVVEARDEDGSLLPFALDPAETTLTF